MDGLLLLAGITFSVWCLLVIITFLYLIFFYRWQ
jgi:hypothetical protein